MKFYTKRLSYDYTYSVGHAKAFFLLTKCSQGETFVELQFINNIRLIFKSPN